jgi:hypothetical protein
MAALLYGATRIPETMYANGSRISLSQWLTVKPKNWHLGKFHQASDIVQRRQGTE